MKCGEKVRARWKDGKYYLAKILEINKEFVKVKYIQDNIIDMVKTTQGRYWYEHINNLEIYFLYNSCNVFSVTELLQKTPKDHKAKGYPSRIKKNQCLIFWLVYGFLKHFSVSLMVFSWLFMSLIHRSKF